MKIIGVVMVVISSTSVGIYLSNSVRQRSVLISQMIIALQLMKSEISSHGSQLSDVFAVIAKATKGSVSDYFANASQNLFSKYWMNPSESLHLAEVKLKELEPKDPVREVLRDLSLGIGRFDMENQLQSIDNAIIKLKMTYNCAEQDKINRCKTYKMLGICSGIALAIILI